MSSSPRKSLRVVQEPDDFKVIIGIGPKIEVRLIEAGIFKYEQLANLSPEEIIKILGELVGLSVEKIEKQNWIGQARSFADKAKKTQTAHHENLNHHMHYATFTVEVLLDDENNARRTRTIHIQSETEQTWAGWDQERLVHFFTQYANLHLPETEARPAEKITPPELDLGSSHVEPATDSGVVIWLSELLSIPEGCDRPYRSIPKDKAVNFMLKLNFAKFLSLRSKQIPYSATVRLRKMDSGVQRTIGTTQGLLKPAESLVIEVKGEDIPEGVYQMNASIELDPKTDESDKAKSLKAELEGTILQVY
jgi:hypothetical protein